MAIRVWEWDTLDWVVLKIQANLVEKLFEVLVPSYTHSSIFIGSMPFAFESSHDNDDDDGIFR